MMDVNVSGTEATLKAEKLEVGNVFLDSKGYFVWVDHFGKDGLQGKTRHEIPTGVIEDAVLNYVRSTPVQGESVAAF